MHKNEEIETAASALANQLIAGIKLREAVARMSKLQPQYSEFWATGAQLLGRGARLSSHLEGEWPENIVAAVRAGEESESIEPVMRRTAQALAVKAQVKKIYSKLLSPVVAFLAGFGVFLFFMVGVIPSLQSSLGGGESSLVFTTAVLMKEVIFGYWPLIVGALAGAIVGSVTWLKKAENIDKLIEVGDGVPRLNKALRSLYFGMWANQIALLDSAGLPIKQQLLLSVKTLPACYQQGVVDMAGEVEKRGIADSSDPDTQDDSDARRNWPFYISAAFMTAHETGKLDVEMQRCAPILIDEGIKELTKVISVADVLAKFLASGMIGIPLTAYFSQLASSLTNAFG